MTLNSLENTGCLVVQGPDRAGLVAKISTLLARHDGNIVSLDQYSSDHRHGTFYQRVAFSCVSLEDSLPSIRDDLQKTMAPLSLKWRLVNLARRKRIAILVSKSNYCLLDLLWQQQRGILPVTIPLVISNHQDNEQIVRGFGIPYFHVPTHNKNETESAILELLAGKIDLVVLARYMQILSRSFLEQIGVPIINIHHSFLPAFAGADPYGQAKRRGVKLIGATAHYVTEGLDEGPIIEQDVARVTHALSVEELRTIGGTIERRVLSRAVLWHVQERVIQDKGQTIVFANSYAGE
ncbi:MAG TPA: formyltetrahydrofolate deformylase [Nevskiaceae bacterium]